MIGSAFIQYERGRGEFVLYRVLSEEKTSLTHSRVIEGIAYAENEHDLDRELANELIEEFVQAGYDAPVFGPKICR